MAALFVVWLEAAAATQCSARYAAATASPAATDAAMQILAMGGSAADAAVAIQMVLCVVEPQSSGIGGGSIALYRNAWARRMIASDGLAKSPSAYDPESANTAGSAHRGLAVVFPARGRLPWRVLFDPAIALADGGFAVSPCVGWKTGPDASERGLPTWADRR